MTNLNSGTAVTRADIRKIAIASVVGTTVEWYDLFVFATASALIFNKVFFPSFDPLVGTLLAFSTFASAYLARMIGAIVFGHFGDRIGRKSMLLFSLVLMGIATALIGLLPGYETIGVWAPVLLVVLRLLQGLALGGEWGGAVLMAVEHAPADKRGLYGSWVQIGVPAGTLLANSVFLIMGEVMSPENMMAWGWRIPFVSSLILVVIGIYVRLSVIETPSFVRMQSKLSQNRVPFVDLMRNHWRTVLLGGVAALSIGSSFNLVAVFGLAHGTQTLHIARNEMLVLVLIACAFCIVLLPLLGALSDRIGRKTVIFAGIAAEIVVAFPMFWLMDTGSFAGALAGLLLMMAAFAANFGPIATYLAELFDTGVRYTGLSICYMLAGVLGSAMTPIITTWLLHTTGSGASVAWYMIGSSLVSMAALLMLSKVKKTTADLRFQ